MEYIGYCRLSREDSRDENNSSIINQKQIIQDYAKEHGFEISRFYTDINESGYTLDRTNFNKVKELLNDNEESITLIVKDFSRIARNSARLSLFLENIKDSKHRVISISDNYDSLKEDSNDFVPLYGWIGEKFVRDTSRKVRASIKTMQSQGAYISSLPYGYRHVLGIKNKYEVDPIAAHYVKKIFDWYINDEMGLNSICRKLMSEGAPTYTMLQKQRIEERGEVYNGNISTTWHAIVIRDILHNDFYIGTLTLRKSKKRAINGKKYKTEDDERFVFENAHEPIIDKATFNLTQEIYERRIATNHRGKRDVSNKRLFSGLLQCSDCGKTLISAGRKPHNYYICRTYKNNGRNENYGCTPHSISEEYLLDLIANFLKDCRKNLISTIEEFDEIVREEYKRRKINSNSIESIENNLEQAKAQLKYIMEQKMKETIKNPEMADLIEETYNSMQKEKYNEVKQLETQLDNITNSIIDENGMKSSLKTALEIFDDIIDNKCINKKQLEMIIDKIIVYETNDVDIYLRGNLHELCINHKNIIETKEQRMTTFAIPYILNKKDKFTGEELFKYVTRECGIRIGSKAFYEYLRKLISSGIIEMLPTRKGYKLLIDNKDNIASHIPSELVVKDSTWGHNNKNMFVVIEDIYKWITYITDDTIKMF